ncbi:NAD(P)H-dependent oxidoreductase [Candidatus Woesearchaeota archaeon]|nr:NAD(P)H-dependent oxidoreductase [Candidatus Woesearchaeota archaeon]MCF7900751.1 NAD(P)H-dependent oxidoreductase [Candidatus Woesearchaeota archaeon]MCF8012916.1 NAD(P)H-dependent oxidoreductase [Candidatus Woesearchaeota archaeon]
MKEKILIIFAHPTNKGHNNLIFNEIKEKVSNKKISFEVIDLYKDKFDPVLHKNELYTQGEKDISKNVEKYQDLIDKHDKLIFIFPIWWNSPPAILKGFFDKVLTSRFAFIYKKVTGGLNMPVGLLKGKKAAIFYTTGSPKFFYNSLLGARGRKVVCNDTLGFCGIKTKGFHLDNANKIDDKTNIRVSKLVNKGLDWLIK